jgi:hypothetical protein
MKKITKIAAIILATTTFAANAATDGALNYGTDSTITSTGTLDVLLNIDYVIQVNELNDLNLGNFQSGIGGDKVKSDDFCVFTNAESFSLRLHSNGLSGWELEDTTNSANTIPYKVVLKSLDLTGNSSLLGNVVHNTTYAGLLETRNRKNCQMTNGATTAFAPNFNVEVTVEENDMLDAIPSSYKDTIVFVASPE